MLLWLLYSTLPDVLVLKQSETSVNVNIISYYTHLHSLSYISLFRSSNLRLVGNHTGSATRLFNFSLCPGVPCHLDSRSATWFALPGICLYTAWISCLASSIQMFLATAAKNGSLVFPVLRTETAAALSHFMRMDFLCQRDAKMRMGTKIFTISSYAMPRFP